MPDSINSHQWISDAAYYYAEARGFAQGKELDDWLRAELDFKRMLVKRFLFVTKEDGCITLIGLQALANSLGIKNAGEMDLEMDLIQAIQEVTNEEPCYRAEPITPCSERTECLWKGECKKLIAAWCR